VRDALDAFLASIPGSAAVLAKHNEAVALFGFFLSETLGQPITPAAITDCYAAARLRAPRNMSDTMTKSKAFVKDRSGWSLQRDAAVRWRSLVPTTASPAANHSEDERRKTVMVVYGRDEETRRDMFAFLRSLHLSPIEWNNAVAQTGKASPYVGEILTAAFSMAQAFLVLMTPDEQVTLRPELRKSAHDSDMAYQPRPNVILEAGMALAKDEGRTILVATGPLRGMSDLDGRHVVRLDNSAERRNDLIQRLKVAGCSPKADGTDWISSGNFERFT
jgi:predicted nucleotide-binding protein